MKLEDPGSIEVILSRMDKDCATRAVLSVLGGKKKFAEQFTIECGIMSTRTRNRAESSKTETKEENLTETSLDSELEK